MEKGGEQREHDNPLHLETFLVEWKLLFPLRISLPCSSLETFLVEWKLTRIKALEAENAP